MNTLLKTAKDLLKAAQANPAAFNKPAPQHAAPTAAPAKPMAKDDKPHLPNTPEDKAHDVSEHTDALPHALKILDTPEKQKAMLAHLKTLHEPSQQRSPENKAVGQAPTPVHKPAPAQGPAVQKSELLETAKELLRKAKEDPKAFETIEKASSAPMSPKPPMAAPKMPAPPKMAPPMKAPATKAPPMKAPAMQKEEMKKESGVPMNMKETKTSKCSKMSKEEIKMDLKKEWKPKFKKD